MMHHLIQSLHTRWANLHTLIRLLSVMSVLMLVGLIITGPAYHTFKRWWMTQNLAEAQLAVDEARMQKARDLSLTVLRSGDLNIQAFRILEKSAAALGDPRHDEIARALISHPDGTDEDRLTGFTSVVKTLPLGLVGRAWMELTEKNRIKPSFAVAFAERLLTEKRVGESAQVLLSIPEEDRDSDVQQGLAKILIATGTSEAFEEAQRMIVQGLNESVRKEASGWLDVLEKLPISSIQENLLSSIRSLPDKIQKDDPDRFAIVVARLDYAAALPDVTPVIEKTVATWKDKKPKLLAQFLTDLNLQRLLLNTYPADGLYNDPELLTLLLNAAGYLEAWDDMQRLLDTNEGCIPKYLELAHRAILSMNHANSNTGSEIWRSAIAEAKTDNTNNALLKLHQISEDAGLDDLARSAMLDAIRMGHGPLPLYKDQKALCQALSEAGQDSTLLEICSIYLNFEPSNPVLLTQYAYLTCLNDVVEPERLLPPLKLLAKAFPSELPIHTTLATAHLCAGQTELATEVLAPFELEIQDIAPTFRIVFLATRVLNGEISSNDPQIENFPWNTLLISEQNKFRLLIRSAE